MLFEKEKYRRVSRYNIFGILWMLNPFSAFNELVLGRRIPKTILIERNNKKPRWERKVYPCPHCHTLHDARTWSFENKTDNGNWFGLYCPTCGKIIPCITSLFSWMLLVVSFPIWMGFRKRLKEKWLTHQPSRFLRISCEGMPAPYGLSHWFQNGIGWGAYMFLVMGVLFPLIQRQTLVEKDMIFELSYWLIAGIGYGFCTKLFLDRLKRKGRLYHS